MSDSDTRERLTAVSLTVLLVVGSLSVMAVAPATAAGNADLDDETTVTSATSDIVAGTTVGNVDATPGDNYTVARTITDTNDSKWYIEAQSGYVPYANSTMAFDGENTTHQFRSANFSHDQLLDLEHSAGENVTVYSIGVNTTNVSESNAVVDNETFFVKFGNATGTETVTDAETADSDLVEVKNSTGWLAWNKDASILTMEDRTVPNDTFYVAAANGTVSDDFQRTLDAADSGSGVSNVWAPGPNTFVLVKTDTMNSWTPVPVYTASNAPDNASGWYATVGSGTVGGATGPAVHVPDDVNASTMDVKVMTGTGVNALEYLFTFDVWNLADAIPMDLGFDFGGVIGGGVGITALAGGVAVSRRRFAG